MRFPCNLFKENHPQFYSNITFHVTSALPTDELALAGEIFISELESAEKSAKQLCRDSIGEDAEMHGEEKGKATKTRRCTMYAVNVFDGKYKN